MAAPSANAGVRRAVLRDRVARLFEGGRVEDALRVGVEVEWIPTTEGGQRLPIRSDDAALPSGAGLLRRAAGRGGWTEIASPRGAPSWRVDGAGTFTFEPGGQLEFSSVPFDSVDRLVATVEAVLRTVYEAGAEVGVAMTFRGMDPCADVHPVPVLLSAERYRRQAAHYDAVGPWGRRMMTQSAAIHVNVDLGERAGLRWSAANRLAPWATAVFANSPQPASGPGAGHRSWRAAQWRELDPSRTGVFGGDGPVAAQVDAYEAFGRSALDFLQAPPGTPARPFGEGVRVDEAAWDAHLTTLFPEVRPRGYLELRSFDAVRPGWLAAPLVWSVGLLYDDASLDAVHALVPLADDAAMRTAGRTGLGTPGWTARATDLFDRALEGAERLGSRVGPRSLAVARAFRDRFVARGEDPGHELDAGEPFTPAG